MQEELFEEIVTTATECMGAMCPRDIAKLMYSLGRVQAGDREFAASASPHILAHLDHFTFNVRSTPVLSVTFLKPPRTCMHATVLYRYVYMCTPSIDRHLSAGRWNNSYFLGEICGDGIEITARVSKDQPAETVCDRPDQIVKQSAVFHAGARYDCTGLQCMGCA